MLANSFSSFVKTCLSLFILSLFLVSCENEENEIGLDIIGSKNFITYHDTLYTVASTCFQDSIISSGLSDKETNMIGSVFDPVMGKTTSSLAVTFGLSSPDPQFGNNDVVDSVVLSIAYTGKYYGDLLCQQTFRVYELKEILSGTYYSNYRCNHSINEIGSKTFVPNLDSVSIQGKIVAPSLQIKLDNSIGTRVLNADSASLSNNENFVNLLNGVYITADPVNTAGGGALLKFYLNDNQTYINIYYHNDTISSLVYSLNVEDDAIRMLEYNHYDYQHAASKILSSIGDTIYGEKKLFLQALAGLRAKIEIPGLDSIAALGTIAVTSAVISFNVDVEESFFTQPLTFDLVMINEDSTISSIADYHEGASHYDGNYINSTNKINIRIQRQLQQIFNKKNKNLGFYLVIRNSSFEPGRLILYGSNPSDISKRISIDLVYSVVIHD